MNLKNTIFIIIITISIFAIMKKDTKIEPSDKKPTIATSTFSLYEVTRHIAGETVNTFMILPLGVDAHSYEPSPKQVADIYESVLVIYSGAGLEPWIEGFEFKNRTLNISRHVQLRELGEDEHNHQHEEHGDSKVDPHYWLDLQNMIKATNQITQELIELFPAYRELYTKNSQSYTDLLKNLDSEYKAKLSTCQLDTIIVNHNAFSYLADKYGFHVEALSGLSPEAEPSAKNMVSLIEHVKEHNISTVFFESFASDKAMKSIALEAKVSVDTLHPLGNITADEAHQKLSYEDIMRSNLEKISKAMQCR
jgi:zinc transport system substrate-binding protein